MKHTLTALLALTVLTAALTACTPNYPPCPEEDGSGTTQSCTWNADTQGNGTGQTITYKR